jgi:hypothetical protein
MQKQTKDFQKALPLSEGNKFCVTAAVPKENWGRHHTMLAKTVAIAHPHPSTGLISSLIETNGLWPVDKVTWDIAESIRTPNIMANGCNHNKLYPVKTPRNKLEASEPPPSVIALCNQPGPDNLEYASKRGNIPFDSACSRYFFSSSIVGIRYDFLVGKRTEAWEKIQKKKII